MKLPTRLLFSVLAVTILTPAAGLAQAPPNLPLQPGDRVQVKIWADTSTADVLTVQDDGSIMLPRLGPIAIGSVPAGAIGDSVRKAYAKLLNPVSVEVTPLRRVSVVGDVKSPSILYLEPRSTVRDAIAIAGGVTDIGIENPVILIRDSVQTELDHWRRRGDDAVFVRSGDVIIVQREPWIKRNAFAIVSGLGLVVSLIITATRH